MAKDAFDPDLEDDFDEAEHDNPEKDSDEDIVLEGFRDDDDDEDGEEVTEGHQELETVPEDIEE